MTAAVPEEPASDEPAPQEPALPEQSREDTDAAWGDYREPDGDTARLLADRPPHWDDY
jgi:hypothetical protein